MKVGYGYCVKNIHDTEPRIYFRGWFTCLEIFVTFWSLKRGRVGVYNISDKDCQDGGSKINDFSVTLIFNGPYI